MFNIKKANYQSPKLQYQPPPLHIGQASHVLAAELCQRTGASLTAVCRCIAHNLNLVGNIRKFSLLGKLRKLLHNFEQKCKEEKSEEKSEKEKQEPKEEKFAQPPS